MPAPRGLGVALVIRDRRGKSIIEKDKDCAEIPKPRPQVPWGWLSSQRRTLLQARSPITRMEMREPTVGTTKKRQDPFPRSKRRSAKLKCNNSACSKFPPQNRSAGALQIKIRYWAAMCLLARHLNIHSPWRKQKKRTLGDALQVPEPELGPPPPPADRE